MKIRNVRRILAVDRLTEELPMQLVLPLDAKPVENRYASANR